MGDATRTSNSNSDQEPGHYGAGYGEQVRKEAPPQLGPATDGDPPAPSGGEPSVDTTRDEANSSADDGEPVVFTPADVHARPPDSPPTDAAPASEKAGLIFERS